MRNALSARPSSFQAIVPARSFWFLNESFHIVHLRDGRSSSPDPLILYSDRVVKPNVPFIWGKNGFGKLEETSRTNG